VLPTQLNMHLISSCGDLVAQFTAIPVHTPRSPPSKAHLVEIFLMLPRLIPVEFDLGCIALLVSALHSNAEVLFT